jgi:hypothetical protein
MDMVAKLLTFGFARDEKGEGGAFIQLCGLGGCTAGPSDAVWMTLLFAIGTSVPETELSSRVGPYPNSLS